LAWQLDLSLEAFDAYNRTATVEYLELFTQDATIQTVQNPILVDGGITHPSLLMQIIPKENIVCVDANHATCVNEWETSATRAEMKQWVFNLPDPHKKWEKFLDCDALITRTIVEECEANGIKYWMRDESTTVEALSHKIAIYFGLTAQLT
jgi:hypothetical protein